MVTIFGLGPRPKRDMAKTTIEFNEKAADELTRLTTELETSKAEVVRDALSLYAYVVRELANHNRHLAIVEGEDSVKKHIVVPGIRVHA